ncbi:hypothetical protein FRX31_019839 [Thalictrum thalictroides]|uniref:Uncharacterized protein n=1 Tax=Thalictrum thalictroides TaxID=46969 RepID=A0A7J6W215_THATH|nr:hypothetical protein FRX31_019839 [Thalictrum thalictroides]
MPVNQPTSTNNVAVANTFQVLQSIDEEDSEGETPDSQAVVLDMDKSKTNPSKIASEDPQLSPPRRVESDENIIDLTVKVNSVAENHEGNVSHDDEPDENQEEAIMTEDLNLALVPHASTLEGNPNMETDIPLFITDGNECYEEKEDHEGSYGSDSELLKKNKKYIPPLSMQTRSRVGGLSSSSKKGFQCCKDC